MIETIKLGTIGHATRTRERARPRVCGVQDKTKGAALLPALRARVLIDVGGVGEVGGVGRC
ncbi:hypothetical protein FHX57_005154 [Paraburkholderia tropica]|uniref:hypothetical protein n=1 Tax=Paraburkholderia tropica TaxID=92647 RepID=UPI00161E903D|nr:hypothetical protein [Paraburkholderia tropica]MBB3002781.1 hypothetical protein [Paraburkholderia tropica]MBB6321862.1 hypothetical protein [Paraburkholderia tropica]